ncbi:MAG: glycosyltransferase [Pseudomonadota bacterium]|nr:glycosyltransferase [Pseudomonadota bacterium]
MQAINLCKQLSKLTEIDCKIFNLQKEASSGVIQVTNSINLYTLPVNRLIQVAFISYYFIRYRPQIVHCHGFMLHVILLAKLFGIKVVLKSTLLHQDDFDTLLSANSSLIRKTLNKLAIKAIDANNALTKPIYDINKQYVPKNIFKISNMYSGKISDCNGKLNQALIVGAVVPRKDVLGAISFYQTHLASFMNKLLIVGPLEPKSSEYCQRYSEKVRAAIESNPEVEFVGQVSQKEVSDYMKKSRVLILASSSEGMPNVVVEALANNCFVFTRNLDGVSTQIYDSSCGRLLSESYNENLEEIISKSIDTQSPQRFALDNFGAEKIVRKHIEIYKKLLS